jgi:hypothetical protein
MAFKPNYNQQRSDRNRAKELKKQARLQRREEEAAKRRASRGEGDSGGATEGDVTSGDATSVDAGPAGQPESAKIPQD